MKRKITLVVVLIVVLIAAKKGYEYYEKYQDSDDLKIDIDKFQFPELNLSNIFQDIVAKVTVNINNFSDTTFNIKQLKIDVLDQQKQLIAEQQYPIEQSIELKPNQANKFALNLLIPSPNVVRLVKANGGIANVGANYLVSGKYNIPIQIVGFVRAEGIKIPINQKIIV
jgi:SLAP domain-containing protein